MELYMDDKWRLSRKGSVRSGNSSGRISSVSSSSSSSSTKVSSHSRKAPPAAAAGLSLFARRCAALVREQRARFYIARRCVTMLICWREYSGES